ncbi:MAG: hypothetical protein KIT87_07435 [Anaerolineae bacterium]|nr:hypothetical protein [Anaerolineae bacterium]
MGRFALPDTPRWLAVMVLVAFALWPVQAHAQAPAAATILFLDERDLRVDFDRLRGQQGSLTVEIFNKATQAQTVELRVAGLAPLTGRADPKLGWILPDLVRQRIDPSRVGVMALVFRTDIAPDPGVYEGYLVATGELGDVIRRQLILEVGGSGQPGTPTIKVEGSDAITLSAVNYLPSLLSPLLPTLLLLGFGLAALLSVARLATGRLNVLLGLVTVVAVALALVLVGEWGTRAGLNGLRRVCATAQQSPAREVCRALTFGLEPSLVVATPVSVAPITGDLPGEATAGVGGSKLVVNNGLLSVQDVPRAGKYEWKVDLRPDDEKQGNIGITALVSDWWPWAAVTLGLGLLLGRWVTQYFQTWRGQAEQEVRQRRLGETIPKDEDQFWTRHPDLASGELRTVRVAPLAKAWLDDVELALKAQDTQAAQDSLNSLETYLAAFRLLRDNVVELHAQRDEVWGRVPDWVALDDDNIEIFAAVKAEFHRPFEYISPAQSLKDVQARLDHVAAYQDWLAALDRTLRLIAAYDEHADNIPEGTEEQRERLDRLRADLRYAAATAITTNSRATVDIQNDAADDIGHAIEELHLEIDRDAAVRRDGARLRLPQEEAAPGEGGGQRFLDLLGRPGRLGPGVAGGPRPLTADELQRLYQQSELQMSVIAGVIAVGSGMLALYFSNPSWGSPADYLKALLWGSTVSEGLKYVNVLLRRVWS